MKKYCLQILLTNFLFIGAILQPNETQDIDAPLSPEAKVLIRSLLKTTPEEFNATIQEPDDNLLIKFEWLSSIHEQTLRLQHIFLCRRPNNQRFSQQYHAALFLLQKILRSLHPKLLCKAQVSDPERELLSRIEDYQNSIDLKARMISAHADYLSIIYATIETAEKNLLERK
jgi:hypothetical protein